MLPLLALNQNSYVFLFLFSPQLSHDFQDVNLLSAVPTSPGQPMLVRLRAYILLSRMALALRLQAQHPVPRLVTHIPGVVSIWLPLAGHVSFTQKKGDLYRRSNTQSNMNNVEAQWGVLSLSEPSHWEPSFPSDSLSPCFSPGHPSFPWPLPSGQTL